MDNILFMGGVFNDDGGRPSSYVRKLIESLKEEYSANWTIMNGGYFHDLSNTITSNIHNFQYIFWFCDVPNDKPKLVKFIKETNSHTILIISKNNRTGGYTRSMLVERINKVHANYLLEFKTSIDGQINATLLDSFGDTLINEEPDISKVSLSLKDIFL